MITLTVRPTSRSPRSAARARKDAARPVPGLRRPPAARFDFLPHLLSVVGIATWKARTQPLELIEFNSGSATKPCFSLDPRLLEPGTPWAENVYPADRKRVDGFLARTKPGPAHRSIDYRLIVGAGEPFWVRHWVLKRSPPRRGRRILEGLLLGIEEQKHLEWECLRVSERECSRIGQELHDDLCQVLTGLSCMTTSLGERATRSVPKLGTEIREFGRELVEATNRVRAMAHGLFPAQLEYSTLRHALNEFARQARTRLPIAFVVEFFGKLPRHSPDQMLHIYRIVQEAVGNSHRHGKATRIRISVAADARRVTLRIEDNGKGFPATGVRPEGIGLHVMTYRARMLPGELRFRNLARGGAVVELKYAFDATSAASVAPLFLSLS
jgi:signal transduction histidine kinase